MSANVVCDIHDIIDAYKKYNAPEDIKEEILFFVSELTGISVDTLLEYVYE